MAKDAAARCAAEEKRAETPEEMVSASADADFEAAMREAAAREECAALAEACEGRGGASMPCKLFVGGLSAQTSTEALRAHFSKYGWLIDAVVMSKGGRPRGFGFVTYDSTGPAFMALGEPQWLDGRLVDVKRAVPGERAQERTSNKIFVGGLPQDVTTEDLKGYFGTYGAVADAVVMVDRRTNRSRGFGFVRFASGGQGSAAAEAVLLNFANHRLAGKWVEVKRATPATSLQELSPTSTSDGSGSPASLAMIEGMAQYMMEMAAGWQETMASSDQNVAGGARGHARGRRGRRRKSRMGGDAADASDGEGGEEDNQMFGYASPACARNVGSPFNAAAMAGMDLPPGLPLTPAHGLPLAPLGAMSPLNADLTPTSMAGRAAALASLANTNPRTPTQGFGFGGLRSQPFSAAKTAQGGSENNANRANRTATPPRGPRGIPLPGASPMKVPCGGDLFAAAPVMPDKAFSHDDFPAMQVRESWLSAW